MSQKPKIYSAKTTRRLQILSGCYQQLSNWPRVLAQISLSRLHFRSGSITISSKNGVNLCVPNREAAWWPAVEVLACDAYRIRSISWPSPDKHRQVLDIGAHLGSFTCTLAALLPGATFTCVEPSALTSKWLMNNLERNHLTGRATVLCAAVTDVDGPIDFWEDEEVSGQNSTIMGTKHRKTEVEGLRIDSLFAKLDNPPDIVKLDCEGGEYAAILGGSVELWKKTTHLFLEYHPVEGHGFPELVSRLEQFGLSLVWHEPDLFVPGLGMAYFVRS